MYTVDVWMKVILMLATKAHNDLHINQHWWCRQFRFLFEWGHIGRSKSQIVKGFINECFALYLQKILVLIDQPKNHINGFEIFRLLVEYLLVCINEYGNR